MRGVVYCVLCITVFGIIGGGLRCGLELFGFCISIIIGVALGSEIEKKDEYVYEHSDRHIYIHPVKMTEDISETVHK